MQVDAALVDALHDQGFEIAVETNGTQAPPPGLDWICVSPKAGAELDLRRGQELKLVYPQPLAPPADFAHLPSRTLIEIEGGIWIRGRHTTPRGFTADAEKYLEAALAGWRVLRLVDQQIKAPMIERIISLCTAA